MRVVQEPPDSARSRAESTSTGSDFEYVVVGSGAGGGVVAARLAQAGHRVLLLEAGGDPASVTSELGSGRSAREDYRVPAFHPFASENPAIKWDFFVRHYESEARQAADPKYVARRAGVLYPRAAALGGCTAHNAMIAVYPHNDDWDAIARITADASWSAESMRTYFERLEECRHRPPHLRWLARLGLDPSRHGWRGWLPTEVAVPSTALDDSNLKSALLRFVKAALEEDDQREQRVRWMLQSRADPNDWRAVRENAVGIRYLPLSTDRGVRVGTRELVLRTQAAHPENLTVELHALATRVLFERGNRAVGVEYLKGERLYGAHGEDRAAAGELRQVRVSREVILCGGAFNTPQLLMLSGIGPAGHLRRHGIEVRVDLPGVGRNLQDRYEVGVVHRMRFPEWSVLKDSRFERDDPQHREWSTTGKGVYATNGCALAVLRRSSAAAALPDLCCLALLGNFPGYYPGYSGLLPKSRNYLTWAILKAHTRNTAGRVELASADPRQPPQIDFRYFDESIDPKGEDLASVAEAIRFVRRIMSGAGDLVEAEELPGPAVQSDSELAEFVRNHAWGHHASCTCAIGPRELEGVVGTNLEVHGTTHLRVVDASVFPRIPGFFPMIAVYMVAEKAADVIAAAARSSSGAEAHGRA